MLRWFTAALALIAILTLSCARPEANSRRAERPRFKGVELYSWQDEGGAWTFALVDGTNRPKSADEVRSSPERIAGFDALEAAFSRLAIGEQVFWLHHLAGLSLPGPELRARAEEAARRARIELSTAGDPDPRGE